MTRGFACLLATTVLIAGTSVVGVTHQESLETLQAKAEQGDAEAQYNLGNLYRQGQGVAADDVEAAKWFRVAADQGLDQAQNSLAILYMTCLLYTSPSPRDRTRSRMPSSA